MALKLDKSNLVRNLAKKHKFVQHLDKAIAAEEYVWGAEFKPKKGDTAWHPSGDCTPSPYELYLKATGPVVARQLPANLAKTFVVGHFWHQFLQFITLDVLGFCEPGAVERRGLKTWAWVKAFPSGAMVPKPFHWVTGAGDLAPVTLPGFGEYLVDFKTMGSHDFKRNGMPPWAADKYECQINIYMDLFDIEKALIVAINKDTPHDMKEFEFHRNQPLIDAVYSKWHLVSACLDEDITPPEDEIIDLPLKGPVE